MLKKAIRATIGLVIMPFGIRFFKPSVFFKDRSVAVVGAADSAFVAKNGSRIDKCDYVVRVNKSLVTWKKDKEEYLGTRTDVLFHSFFENMDTGGGGPIVWPLFKKHGLRYLVQPRSDRVGLRSVFNYFKKYLNYRDVIYVLPGSYYRTITGMFGQFNPTRGFCALYSALTSECKEVLITGFTFFKTAYADGYRDNIKDATSSMRHIEAQGLHDADMEYNNFIRLIEKSPVKNIVVDVRLYEILAANSPGVLNRVSVIESELN